MKFFEHIMNSVIESFGSACMGYGISLYAGVVLIKFFPPMEHIENYKILIHIISVISFLLLMIGFIAYMLAKITPIQDEQITKSELKILLSENNDNILSEIKNLMRSPYPAESASCRQFPRTADQRTSHSRVCRRKIRPSAHDRCRRHPDGSHPARRRP
nr:MAG TPA: hypothetical protein [Caudoviricetes sp.]